MSPLCHSVPPTFMSPLCHSVPPTVITCVTVCHPPLCHLCHSVPPTVITCVTVCHPPLCHLCVLVCHPPLCQFCYSVPPNVMSSLCHSVPLTVVISVPPTFTYELIYTNFTDCWRKKHVAEISGPRCVRLAYDMWVLVIVPYKQISECPDVSYLGDQRVLLALVHATWTAAQSQVSLQNCWIHTNELEVCVAQ